MLKIKVLFREDLRVVKTVDSNFVAAFDALNKFITETFNVNNYNIQYFDDENDLVTIASGEDLNEAHDFAVESNRTLKVQVTPRDTRKNGSHSATENVQTPIEGEDNENYNSENGAPNCEAIFDKLVNDDNFRYEIVSGIQDVILQLRDGDDFTTAVQTALASHESISNEIEIEKLLPFLTIWGQFVSPFVSVIDPNAVPSIVENFVEKLKSYSEGGRGGGSPCGFGHHLMSNLFGGFSGMNASSPFGNVPPFADCPPPFAFGFGHGFGNGFGGAHCGRRRFGACGRGRGRGRKHGGHHWRRHGHCNENADNDKSGECGVQSDACHKKKRCKKLRADIIRDDLTIGDKAVVFSGTAVVKTWLLKNSGSVSWPEGTTVVYVGRPFNELIDGVSFPVNVLNPDEEGEISVVLSAPQKAGRYSCKFRLQTPDGKKFGQMLRTRVNVVSESVEDEIELKSDEFEILNSENSDVNGDFSHDIHEDAVILDTADDNVNTTVDDKNTTLTSVSASASASELTSATEEVDTSLNRKMDALSAMGFRDVELNRTLLENYNGSLDGVLNALFKMQE